MEDYLSNEGSNDINIDERWKKGIGLVSQVISLIKEVTLGQYYFKIGLSYRKTNIVNGLLFNSEIWYNLKKCQIKKLEIGSLIHISQFDKRRSFSVQTHEKITACNNLEL